MTVNERSSTIEPLLDLRGLVAGILWRRRLWASVALLGVLAGALATLLLPPEPTAAVRVLIARQEEVSVPETLMATDLAVFETTATAAKAVERLGLGKRPKDFLDTFEGEALTSHVLEITAQGASDKEAVRRARVLAKLFIAGHVERARDAAEAEAQALLDRRAQLRREFVEVTNQIPTASGDRLDVLTQRRGNLTEQIASLGQQAQDAFVGLPSVEAGTQIVDPPRALPTSLAKTAAINIAVGLVFGLAAGVSLAAVLCVTRDRPVLRRDIAAHLGVSVIAALPAVRGRRLGKRGRRAREHRRAASTLAHLARDAPGPVWLLEVGCPRTTATLGLAIADELAADGPVTLVDHLDGGHLENAGGRPADDRVEMVTVADSPPGVDPRNHCLGVRSLGPGTSWTDLDRLGSHALLVVRAGHASTLWLHTVARRLAHTGVSAIGVVLVQPYPWDGTDGTLWHDLHSVLRAKQPANGIPRLLDSKSATYRNGSVPAELGYPGEEMRM